MAERRKTRRGWLERLQLGYRGREPSEPHALSSAHVQGVVHELHDLSDLADAAKQGHVAVTFDLGGRALSSYALPQRVTLPPWCTVCNGTILLRSSTQKVRVAAGCVRFQGVTLKGMLRVEACGSLEMEGCHVGSSFDGDGGGVSVLGSSALLSHTTLQGGYGAGMLVYECGRAVLNQCRVSDSLFGVVVSGQGSALHAAHSHMDGNHYSNIEVCEAHVSLEHVRSSRCKDGYGVRVTGQDSSVSAMHSEMCVNTWFGAAVEGGGTLTLVRRACSNNKFGFRADGPRSCIVAESSCAKGNRLLNAFKKGGGHIICYECDLDGQEVRDMDK